MATFKKQAFEKKLKENREITEFVTGDGAMIGGDRSITSNSEIETGPIAPEPNDDSGYEKGVSTTTDRAARYRQPRGWFGSYSVGGARLAETDELKETALVKAKQMVEDLLKNKTGNDGVVNKYSDTDINRNKIPDLEELGNPAAMHVCKEFLDVIKHNNLNGEQVGIALNFIISNIDTTKIPMDYKKLLNKGL